MRLGQLSRQLGIETSKAVKFLKTHEIEIENHLNTKLDDNAIELLIEKFTPEVDSETLAQETVEKPSSFIDQVKDTVSNQLENAKEFLEEIKEDVEESFEEKKEDATAFISKAKKDLSEKVDDAKEFASEANENLTEMFDDSKEIAAEAKEKINQTASQLSQKIGEAKSELSTKLTLNKDTVSESADQIKPSLSNQPEDSKPVTEPTSDERPEFEPAKTLTPDEVHDLVEKGEIQSAIEAEAAQLTENGKISAKLKKLEGLHVVGKIELPHDPRREKKEAQRKEKEQHLKEVSLAGKTIDGVHPNKRTKEEAQKIAEELKNSTPKPAKKKKKKRENITGAKQTANQKFKGKKNKQKKPVEKTLTPEEVKKKKAREKRQKIKEKANAPAPKRSVLQKIWDFIK